MFTVLLAIILFVFWAAGVMLGYGTAKFYAQFAPGPAKVYGWTRARRASRCKTSKWRREVG